MRDSRRINSLMYHDLVDDSDTSASGFEGAAADRYKQTPENFESHLDAIEQRCFRAARAVCVDAALSAKTEATPWVATFDDGGVSAVDAAVRLKQRVTWDAKKAVKWLLGTRYIRSTRKVHERLKAGGDLAATLAARTR